MIFLKSAIFISLFYSSLNFSQEYLNPVGTYNVLESHGDSSQEYTKKCPGLVDSSIEVTKEHAVIMSKYFVYFRIWNHGEDEYWSLGELERDEKTFQYQTRGMGEFTYFSLKKKRRNSFHLELRVFFPFDDSNHNRGSICSYDLVVEKD